MSQKKSPKLGRNSQVGARSGGSVEGSHVEVKEEIRRLASQKNTSHLESLGDSLLPETKPASLPLKMYGWNTIVSFWGPACFQGLC